MAKHFKRATLLAVCALLLLAGARAAFSAGSKTAPLLTAAIDDNLQVKLAGNTRLEANAANDRGPVAADLPLEHMLLLLRRSPAQENAFEQYLDQLEDPKSPNYHRWLTADEIGQRYGMAQQDLATLATWLTSRGFTVNQVYPSGVVIDFSGNAGQVRDAFHTEIHNLAVNGVAHIANMSDPRIPAALAPAVVGVVSLNDFRPRPMNLPRPAYTFAGCEGLPGSSCYAMVPADLATIYNFNPLFAGGYSGQGQTIVVLEDSDLYKASDWTTFRNTFGLTSAYPDGSMTQVHPGCSDPGVNGDDAEAEIDVEWSSAGAPSAAIEMAACASTETTFGGYFALANILNASGTPPAIVSISYGESEAENGATQNAYINTLYQQAVGEGVSVFVAAGDEGAASSDADQAEATHGIGVSAFSSTPYNVSVGGTDFGDGYANSSSTYWSNSNSPTDGSALSYVPEIPWNDSCASSLIANYLDFPSTVGSNSLCNDRQDSIFLEVAGGSGGPSGCATGTPSKGGVVSGSCAGYPKPGWQSVSGNPSDGVRDIPDLSLFAADGVWNHYYVICYSDPATGRFGAPCSGAPSSWAGFGGTSFASPVLAAVQALINQKTGSRYGNPNPVYYSLAKTEYGSGGSTSCNSTLGNEVAGSCIFYNVTQGDIDMPCKGSNNCYTPAGKYGALSTSNSQLKPAYAAAAGWNFATGIGTVNAYNLVMAFDGMSAPTPTPTATATSATPTPTPTATSTSTTPTPTVTATPTATPTVVPESLVIKPLSVNFGKVKVGHVATVTLKVKNPGGRGLPITFGVPPATMSNSPIFAFPGNSTNCPAQLKPKKQCKLTVSFAPAMPGLAFSSLTVFDNAGNANQVIQLRGAGK